MIDFSNINDDFLKQLILKIEENLADEYFGVSELAGEVNMSRSNLLRKVKSSTSLSVSQLIRKVRLKNAKVYLEDNRHNISEIAIKVGFSSTSYFIKCFKDEYGFPPGEYGKTTLPPSNSVIVAKKKTKVPILVWAAMFGIALAFGVFLLINSKSKKATLDKDKSIAVLPFKNDSNDSSNVYIVNGLMEAILNNLQKIEDLRVVSRTSVEKYREDTKTIKEISNELGVKYFIEGSGQKIGDQLLLTIQLIEAPADKHIWAERYARQTRDIFMLQTEVAKDIASQIEVVITPEEEKRINKAPTNNLVAYDYYMKGKELANTKSYEALIGAIEEFKNAIEEDESFANAYAFVAICYYYMDIFKANKKYSHEIKVYADKAIQLDAESPESLIAKGLYFMHNKAYEMAIENFEKVLQYNPNSGWVNNMLSDIYSNLLPDTKKYLKHALKFNKLNIGTQDSVTASYLYLHLSNALIQSGFLDESIFYIKKSLAYNADNIFSQYVHAYLLYAKNRDIAYTKKLLIETLQNDTSRVDVLQEVGKVCYYNGDYEESMFYFRQFLDLKEKLDLDIFPHMDAIIGYVMQQQGLEEESKIAFEKFRKFAENDESIYRGLHLATYYSYHGEIEKAMKHLRTFSEMKNIQYWLIMFLKNEPLFDNIKSHPDFDPIMKKIHDNFWKEHQTTKIMLMQEGLI